MFRGQKSGHFFSILFNLKVGKSSCVSKQKSVSNGCGYATDAITEKVIVVEEASLSE